MLELTRTFLGRVLLLRLLCNLQGNKLFGFQVGPYMTELQKTYGSKGPVIKHPMNAPRSEDSRLPPDERSPGRKIIRAATEESEEFVRYESRMKANPMLPPPFQRPIPTKPEGFGMYHHPGQGPRPGHHPPSPAHYRPSSGQHHSVQSVITSSFSIEDGSFAHERGMSQVERRHDGSARKYDRCQSDTMDQREPPPHFVVTTSSHDRQEQRSNLRGAFSSPLSRSFSSGSDLYSPPVKRSFFHHANSNDHSPTHVPPEFMPPKRKKLNLSSRKEILLQPRQNPPGQNQGGWFHRRHSWDSRDDEQALEHGGPISEFSAGGPPVNLWYRQAGTVGPGGQGGHGPVIHRPAARLPPINAHPPFDHSPEHESPPSYWNQSPPASWPPSHYPPSHDSHQFWGPSSYSWQQHRDDTDSSRNGPDPRDGYRHGPDPRDGYDVPPPNNPVIYSNRDQIFRPPHMVVSNRRDVDKMEIAVETSSFPNGSSKTASNKQENDGKPLLLLALPQDRVTLSETLCVVRDVSSSERPNIRRSVSTPTLSHSFLLQNIEVFTATQSDVDAPAPGRKHAVVVGQVGLRCIHCRHTTRASDRVKRAVCYPSSIKRIYRTVIDMKLDHFSQCKFVPKALTERLNELKAVHTRSTGTTMQYFIKAAHMLGMEDGASGVRLNMSKKEDLTDPNATTAISSMSKKKSSPSAQRTESFSGDSSSSSAMETSTPPRQDSMVSAGSFESTMASEPFDVSGKYFEGKIPLALPEDKTALSPLRCFLRDQVCAFSATEEDIAVRAPTTFSIAVGQVGIGCIHCLKQSPKYRSNRAVCFPFSIGRIYQSVADIQRFHLGECKMLPSDVKEAFLSLQSASSKGSKGLATRQYWVASARKLGLVDTQRGIRFGRDPSQPPQAKSFSLDILAQAAFSVTTTNKKLVLPEDRDTIAEFLYVVMEQLQPCRFTEADRNKRRVRDVGCIGVECKHCAGQVDGRKFFWSSVSAVESNFVSVHTHILECRMVPQELKDKLTELKKLRKEQTAQLMTGSQKSFFRRVWERLHREEIVAAESPASSADVSVNMKAEPIEELQDSQHPEKTAMGNGNEAPKTSAADNSAETQAEEDQSEQMQEDPKVCNDSGDEEVSTMQL